MTKVQLSLNNRQHPKQSNHPNHATIEVIPENANYLVISNFDSKKCCHLTIHLFGKNATECWDTFHDVKENGKFPLDNPLRYAWAIELMPDGIKNEIIELDVHFE